MKSGELAEGSSHLLVRGLLDAGGTNGKKQRLPTMHLRLELK